jgi:hypothetical protein
MNVLAESDVVLSLDWIELGGAIKSSFGIKPVNTKIIQISSDQHSHTGWNMEHFGLAPMDIYMLTEPDVAVPLLLAAVKAKRPKPPALPASTKKGTRLPLSTLEKGEAIEPPMIATALKEAVGGTPVTLLTICTRWDPDHWEIEHPLDAIGGDGGGGLGSGPGIAVGAALALRGSGRWACRPCGRRRITEFQCCSLSPTTGPISTTSCTKTVSSACVVVRPRIAGSARLWSIRISISPAWRALKAASASAPLKIQPSSLPR